MAEEFDYIIPDLKQFAVPIDSILPDPANAIEHTERDLTETMASIQKYGQRFPIFVNKKNNTIEAGEGRWRAMKKLGYSHIAVVGVHDDEITAIGFGIADNATGRIAQFDPEKLSKLFEAFEEPTDIAGVDEHFLGEIENRLSDMFGEEENSDGGLLELVNVTVDEPQHQVEHGDVWQLDQHVLICCDVLTEWEMFVPFLEEGDIFAPYPGVFVPLSVRAREMRLVMVQPDKYIAGHIIDRYVEQGHKAVKKNA